MARIAVIVGHTRRGTLCDALADAYADAARTAGHSATVTRTATLAFDPILREAYVRVQPREPDLEAAYDAMIAADHLVLVFPLWLGTLPAILKAFLERAIQPELVEPARTGRFVKVLAGKSARIVVTMGMPALIYRWWFGAHAVRMLRRNVLGFMGARPIRTAVFGNVEGAGDAGRARWLARMAAWGQRAL